MTYRDTPKVELHTHLEGCAPPAFIRGLAAEKSIDISGISVSYTHLTLPTTPYV